MEEVKKRKRGEKINLRQKSQINIINITNVDAEKICNDMYKWMLEDEMNILVDTYLYTIFDTKKNNFLMIKSNLENILNKNKAKDIYDMCLKLEETRLQSHALHNKINVNFAKFLLISKHNYKESKTETETVTTFSILNNDPLKLKK